jgi:hypothetical protein
MVGVLMSNSLNDRSVVDSFVAYLRDNGHFGLQVDSRPDDENRQSSDIDALAGTFAIEHTSVDTVEDQRRDSDWFMKVIGGLENELSQKLQYRLRITLPYEGVRKGQNWSNIHDAFKTWIINSSASLPDGTHSIHLEPDIPFGFHVNKASSGRAGLIFSRIAPEDRSMSDRLRVQLSRKVKKLAPYKRKGYKTVLLVESEDIALMDENTMLEAIRNAFSGIIPAGVDQVWFVDTSIPAELLFFDMTGAIQ